MSTAYPTLRSVLRPELAESNDAFIESLVHQHYGGAMDAVEAEEFLNDIGRSLGQFGRGVANVAGQAAPHVMNALPGVLSGAATGAALGPWGALAGAAIGGVTSAIGSAQAGQPGPSRPRVVAPAARARSIPRVPRASGGAVLGQVAGLAGPVLGAFAQAGGSSSGIGGQIAGLLGRPEIQQALMSQLLGALGRQSISVGGAQVPTGAMMNMVGTLFQRAGQPTAGAAEDESIPAYLLDASGQLRIDSADPDARADALAEWFHFSAPPADFGQQRAAEAAWSWQNVDESAGWADGLDEFESIDESDDDEFDDGFMEDDEGVALTTSSRDLESVGW